MPTDQPVRCPLCGGYPHDRYRACDNPDCELPVKHWPRIAELVAIRDAAVAVVQALTDAPYRAISQEVTRLKLLVQGDRPHDFRINWGHPLAQGLVFAGLRRPNMASKREQAILDAAYEYAIAWDDFIRGRGEPGTRRTRAEAARSALLSAAEECYGQEAENVGSRAEPQHPAQ